MGNALNHPETIGPDMHTPGSPLPPPLFGFVNAIGYTPDGTSMELAGNQMNRVQQSVQVYIGLLKPCGETKSFSQSDSWWIGNRVHMSRWQVARRFEETSCW